MKKLFTSAALALSAMALTPAIAQDITYADYAGGYVCTTAEGIEGSYDYDWAEAWIGHKMNIKAEPSGWDEGLTDLVFYKLFPQGDYEYQGVYVRMEDPAAKKAYVISKRSYLGSSWTSRKLISTSSEDGADLDINCGSYDYPAGTADGINDLVITWSEDLNSFTVEGLLAKSVSDESTFKAAKIVYEKSMTPAEPSLSGSFNKATGFNDITVILPSTYDYDSGYSPIKVNFDKVVLERSIDWGSTWTTMKEWTSTDAELTPGLELKYTDEDLNFDDPDHTWYNYKVTVYIGPSSSNYSNGVRIGIDAPSVLNLKAEAGEKGALPVTISFNLPKEESLTMPLTKVEICRFDYNTYSDVILATLTEDLTAEREITFEDADATENSMNAYKVYTYWKYGRGMTSASAYVGLDVPGEVPSFEAKAESAKKVVLTWKAPVKGNSGGYIDPTATIYKLTRRLSDDWGEWKYDDAAGEWVCVYSSLTVLGEDMTETTYTDELEEVPEGLYRYTYELYTYVAGMTDLGYGGSLVACFGYDDPGTPKNFEAKVDVNTINLSWEMPTSGNCGGYFDPEKLVYKVTRRLTDDYGDYNYDTYELTYPSEVTLATDIKETSWVDNIETDKANSYRYDVFAYLEGKDPNNCTSIDVLAGPKNGIGFKEGFEAKNTWNEALCENLWDIPYNDIDCAPANYIYYDVSETYKEVIGKDADGNDIFNQFLIFKLYDSGYWWAAKGCANATPYTFDLTGTDLPVVLYRVLMIPTENNGKLSICAGTLAEGQTVNDLPAYATESNYDADFELVDNKPTWRDCVALLPEIAGNDDCLINFHYESGDLVAKRAFFAIDDIEVRDYKAPVLTTNSINTEAEKTHSLAWTDPSTDDLLVEGFEIYRTKTQKTGVQEIGATEYTDVYPEEELGNEYELIATLKDDAFALEYVDNMFGEDGKTFDATQHIYKVVAVYSDPVEIKSSSKPVQVMEGATTGVESLGTIISGAQYYNLQGQPIVSPAKGQIVIEVKDGKASKIVR